MNLLELMLKEKVEWPAGAEFAAQDGDDRTVQFCFESPVKSELGQRYWVTPGMAAHSKIRINTLADDWSTCIITREEYQAAGGWMKWEGGDRPVGSVVMTETKWSDGGTEVDLYESPKNWITDYGRAPCIIAYRIINQRPAQLDNPEIEPGFEPFVSVEDAHECKAEHAITPSKYTKQIHGASVDVYDVLMAWGVTNPALQHLIKKALQCGQRGHKDKQQDLQDIIDSAIRAKELEQDA